MVVIRLTSNSLSSLSVIISRCSKPKNPHLNPKPRALDDSGSKEKLESFNFSFANPSLSFWYSELSTGNKPQNTTGLLGLKPGRGLSIGAWHHKLYLQLWFLKRFNTCDNKSDFT